jgi:hypothetical protein
VGENSTTIRSMQSTIEVNNKYIEAMQGYAEENASFQCIISPLKRYGGLQKVTDKPTLIAAVGSVIIALMSVLMRKTMSLSRLCVVCDALFQNFIFGVDATKTMLSKLQKIFFREQCATFAPWKVLRAINLSSVGGLNYNGLETLRNVEDLERYQWGALPSMSAVQRASQSKSVELSITLHGAELCDGISHLTSGIKVTDARAIDPRDGSPLCMTIDEMMGLMFLNQSQNNCFALKSLIEKDCKKAYKEFADFFQFFKEVKRYGLPVSEHGPRIMAMDIWSPQDLSTVWKCSSTGSGASKNGKTHFCHLCACCGDNIAHYVVKENSFFFKLFYAITLVSR